MTPSTVGHQRGAAVVDKKLRRAGLVIGIWFWAVYALYAVGISVGNAAAGNDLEISAFDATLGAARWPMAMLGIIASAAILTIHVAAGGTRRSLFEGVVRAALWVGAGFGVLTTLVLLGEQLLSTSLGMSWRRLGGLPFDTPAAVLGTTVAEGLVAMTYILVGAGIGAGFARAGAWRGTLLIVPLVLPAVLVDVATRTGLVGSLANVELRPDLEHAEVPPAEGLLPLLVGLGGGVLAVALAAIAFRLVLRTISVRPG